MLGRPVAYQLKNDGFQVRILTRVPEKAKTFFDPSFEIFKGDLRNQKEKKCCGRVLESPHQFIMGNRRVILIFDRVNFIYF